MDISDMKGQGWRVIITQRRKASDILTSSLAAFLFSSHPKRERDREAHLDYYASAFNRGRQLSHHKTKLNQIQQKSIHPSLRNRPRLRRHCIGRGPSWPAPHKKGDSTPTFRPMCLLWPNGWMDQDTTWYGGRYQHRPHCVR